jgi:hypothetical protein
LRIRARSLSENQLFRDVRGVVSWVPAPMFDL